MGEDLEKKRGNHTRVGIVAVVIFLFIVGYFLIFGGFGGDNIITARTITELVLDVSELPRGYKVVDEGAIKETDVTELAMDIGFEEGYKKRFIKGNNFVDVTSLELSVSKYPPTKIRKILKDDFELGENWYTEKLDNPEVGDKSLMVVYKKEDSYLREYEIRFVKKDVYVILYSYGPAADTDFLIGLANEIAAEI